MNTLHVLKLFILFIITGYMTDHEHELNTSTQIQENVNVIEEDSSIFTIVYTEEVESNIEMNTIENEEINILHTEEVDNNNILFYTKLSDEELIVIYTGIRMDTIIYEIGLIGYGEYNFATDKLISTKKVKVFGKDLIVVKGFQGAAYEVSFYIDVSHTVPTILLITAGENSIVDLDGDGIHELITSVSLVSSTMIYKCNEGHIQGVDVNKLMNAYFVLYDDKNKLFIVQFDPGTVSFHYIYKDGTLIPDHEV
ncbi:hypothetical protein [Longirhabdus pacifica]|uniref:hypothetical protein n=1 Tax=Longirhabdus pacifica TaxID=2305227 RepID=UPI00100886F4|nr:hypothetical protein [Longirhabdus pacifica]